LRQETLSAPRLARPGAAWLFVLTVAVVGVAAARALARAHGDRMHGATGRAEWIWYTYPIPQPAPIRFFATRAFALAEKPGRALAKLFVDREHVLWVNGERAGAGQQRSGDPLALYEIASFLRAGENRVTIEAASPTGVGGILLSVDIQGFGRDALVTDGDWRVDPSRDSIAGTGRYRPVVWGRPPQYPWGYPRMPRPEEIEVQSAGGAR
jgi:hypothetical protein